MISSDVINAKIDLVDQNIRPAGIHTISHISQPIQRQLSFLIK